MNKPHWTWGKEIAAWLGSAIILVVIGAEVYWLWSAIP